MPEILDLSWKLQFMLATGYAAYIVSFTGIRSHHSTLDTTFCVLILGSLATSALYLIENHTNAHLTLAVAISGLLPIGAGILWRVLLKNFLKWALTKTRIYSDDSPSAWHALFLIDDCDVSQISILTDEDEWLSCSNTSDFKSAERPPVTLGADGGVLLYVTEKKKRGEKTAKKSSNITHKAFGTRLTYIPSNRIKRVTLRLKRK